jgi:hypothetical protein
MKKIIIEDSHFAHSTSSSWYHKPEKFEWDRNTSQQYEDIVITNLLNVDKYVNKKIYGWIIEPPEVAKENYEYVKKNFSKFHKVFTYDKSLLNIDERFEFLPIGGCWIEVEDRKIYEKKKLVCSINSHKRMTSGHKLRYEIIPKLKNVDLYGSGYNPVETKIEVLKDYMYCIVIENQKMDYLFTEKIIDCLVTGTIPIYWGCPSIGDFFDTNSIYTFNSYDELEKILSQISEEDYLSKIDNIKKNFDFSKKYVVADNQIYEKLNDEKKNN